MPWTVQIKIYSSQRRLLRDKTGRDLRVRDTVTEAKEFVSVYWIPFFRLGGHERDGQPDGSWSPEFMGT